MAAEEDFWKGMLDNLWAAPQGKGAAALGQKMPAAEAVERQQQNIARAAAARQREASRPRAQAYDGGGWGIHPFAAHAQAQSDMYAGVNNAISSEMQSRRRQAEAERDRQHELQLASMQQQAQQAQQTQQYYQQQAVQFDDEARKARNRQLLGMTGVHGQSIRTDGRGGMNVSHHSFADSPFGRALLG